MNLARARELSLVTEALCTLYRKTGRPFWSHHVQLAWWLARRMERSRDRRGEIAGWLTAGGSA